MLEKRRIMLIAFMLVLTAVLSACSFGAEKVEETVKKDPSEEAKVINLALSLEPTPLHPQLAMNSNAKTILQNIFEGLTIVKDENVELAAAEKVEVSDDQLTYTFTLRDAKWSNGDEITADDFAYAWEFALKPERGTGNAALLYPIKGAKAFNDGEGNELGIKVVDKKTLEVTLESPTPYFLQLTALPTYFPIHKATTETKGDWYTEADKAYISNGPFQLTDWKHGSSMTLEKNDQYWDAENVSLNKVNIVMVENETTAVTMFDAGEIDFLGAPYQRLTTEAISRYKQQGILEVSNQSAVYMNTFNTTGKFTSNENIRKALTLAIDRQSLIAHITKGEEQPAFGIVPLAVPGFEEDRGYIQDKDIEGAKVALEAGMKELDITDPSQIKMTLAINKSSENASVIAKFIEEDWNKSLGIQVKTESFDFKEYSDKISNLDYDVAFSEWVGEYNDAYSFLERYASAKNEDNNTGWENAQYTDLLKQSSGETDTAARMELLKQAEAIVMEELPVAPIFFTSNLSVKKEDVQNMKQDAVGNVYLKYVDVTK